MIMYDNFGNRNRNANLAASSNDRP